ncbi:aldehyde dehydrogenase [Stenotrophomonas pavanii]|uniref:aldehyde dehydrogenase n=1 Tax=Stenotrophomonas pavanii TaxID=487698 RepID=UPI0039C5D7A7
MKRTIDLKHPDRLYIGGQWVAPDSKETFDVLDCSTEEVIASVPKANSVDMQRAVDAARDAFDNGPWARMTPQERAGYLEKIAARLEARNDDFARVWSLETGIVFKVAQPRIGLFISGAFRQYAEMASTFPFTEEHRSVTGNLGYRVYEPVGVVAEIIPWNGPAGLMAYKTAPALLAGCTLVIKSSPEAPCSAYMLAEICEEVGLPPGVINVVTADRDVSEELVANPAVDKITFTGSTGAGKRIAAVASDRVARVTLELGGKSPAVILDDFDIEEAAKILGNSYFTYNTGQICHSLTRIVVPRAKHDQMVEALAKIARRITLGDPLAEGTGSGPLASARQRDTVQRFVDQGVAEGATLAAGGKRPEGIEKGFFFEPTVFGNVDNMSTIAQEEIFGPVLCVIPANDEADAIRIANESRFGLNAAVFTNDPKKAFDVARKIRAGTVGHNGPRTDFSIGFGGFKQSGVGREGGVEGLVAFMESKTVVMA